MTKHQTRLAFLCKRMQYLHSHDDYYLVSLLYPCTHTDWERERERTRSLDAYSKLITYALHKSRLKCLFSHEMIRASTMRHTHSGRYRDQEPLISSNFILLIYRIASNFSEMHRERQREKKCAETYHWHHDITFDSLNCVCTHIVFNLDDRQVHSFHSFNSSFGCFLLDFVHTCEKVETKQEKKWYANCSW